MANEKSAQVLSLVEYALRVLNRDGVKSEKYGAALAVWNYSERVLAEEEAASGAKNVDQKAV